MNPTNKFDVTKPEWPFGNLLNGKKRREKLENLKSHISGQIEQLKSIAEINFSSTAQDLKIMECCKKNIFLTNQMIKDYNQHTPKKRAVKLLKVDFNLWKTHADNIPSGKLPAAILAYFDAIVANLGYRSVYNLSLTSKLAKTNFTSITSDWLSMAKGFFDKKKLGISEKCFLYTLFFRLMGVRRLKETDPTIQKFITALWHDGLQFDPEDIQDLLYEPEKVNYFFLSKKFVTKSLMIQIDRHPEAFF